MNTTLKEKKATEQLLAKCAVYLNENFHKFSLTNRIRISLELIKRKMPTQLEHSGEVKFTQMPTAKFGNRIGELLPLEFNIGDSNTRATRNLADAGEAPANTN